MGIRLQVNQNQIVSFVEDGDDVQYKRCQAIPRTDQQMRTYNMVVATKNTKDRSGATYITDIDINSITFSALTEAAMPSKELIQQERKYLLDQKLRRNGTEGSSSHDFFMLQKVMEKKLELRENLPYLKDSDDMRGHLSKYALTVQGIAESLERFNELLAAEVRNEDELFSQLISTKQMIETQDQMNKLYATAFEMKEHLQKITSDVTAFISYSKNATLVDPKKLDHEKIKIPQAI